MVDALRRARRWLRRDGCLIDIHPTPLPATIEVDGVPIGHVETADGPARHAAADAAVAVALRDALFVAAGSDLFDFYTYADSLDELREHIEANWRDARVLAGVTDGRPRAHEQVRITKLLVAQGRDSA